jgi:hypothetical protein
MIPTVEMRSIAASDIVEANRFGRIIVIVGRNGFRFWYVLVVFWFVLSRNCNINTPGGNLKQSMGLTFLSGLALCGTSRGKHTVSLKL